MNKKSIIKIPFTIQRLAVIVIIIVIAVIITVPLFTKVSQKEEKSDLVNKVQTLIPLIEDYIILKKYETPITFVFNEAGVNPALEVAGDKPTSGSITVLADGGYIINKVGDGKLCISKSGNLEDMDAKKIGTCEDLSDSIPNISDSGSQSDDGNNDSGGSQTGENGSAVPIIEED